MSPAASHGLMTVEDKSDEQDNKRRNDYPGSFLAGQAQRQWRLQAREKGRKRKQNKEGIIISPSTTKAEHLFMFLLICLVCPVIVRRCLSRVLVGFKYAEEFLLSSCLKLGIGFLLFIQQWTAAQMICCEWGRQLCPFLTEYSLLPLRCYVSADKAKCNINANLTIEVSACVLIIGAFGSHLNKRLIRQLILIDHLNPGNRLKCQLHRRAYLWVRQYIHDTEHLNGPYARSLGHHREPE